MGTSFCVTGVTKTSGGGGGATLAELPAHPSNRSAGPAASARMAKHDRFTRLPLPDPVRAAPSDTRTVRSCTLEHTSVSHGETLRHTVDSFPSTFATSQPQAGRICSFRRARGQQGNSRRAVRVTVDAKTADSW